MNWALIQSIYSETLVPLPSGLAVPFLKMTSQEMFSDGGIQPLVLAESVHFLLLTVGLLLYVREG